MGRRTQAAWASMSVVVVRGRARGPVAFSGFSGTVAQSAVLELLGAGELHGARPKPFAVWPLVAGGRPLLDGAVVEAGVPVELRVGFAVRELARRFVEAVSGRGALRLFAAEVPVEEVEFWEAPRRLEERPCFRAEFVSPARFETHPYYARDRPVYDFTPRPLNLLLSAVAYGRRFGFLRLGTPFLRWAYTYVGLTDFGCRGPCVRTVRLLGGGVARGFVGWALYRAFSQRRLSDLWRALAVAEAFNVGTGRGMGLGAVRITPLDCPGGGPRGPPAEGEQ
jgi:CRISPR-associated endoribonuclease Cas6